MDDQRADKLIEICERIAGSLNVLAEEPVVNVEQIQPLECPHCKYTNPEIREVNEAGGKGPLGEVVIHAECQHCHKEFYALPMTWRVAGGYEDAVVLAEERAEAYGFNK